MENTSFFPKLAQNRQDSTELQNCIIETVDELEKQGTSVSRPGMLLGKVQSGKTRAFLGVIALAFDRGYDVAVILTKGTVSLAQQTLNRVKADFKQFIDEDAVQVFDIMTLPDNLTPYELSQKLILVVKKEDDNLERLIVAFDETYPELKTRRLLIVDDEADFGSLSFRKKGGTLKLGVISGRIEDLRSLVPTSSFLQVTATPYSLYLQPDEEISLQGTSLFKPKRPAFTKILPTHSNYVGGDYYFEQNSEESSTAHFVYQEVPLSERDSLKKEDGRRLKLNDVLTSHNAAVLRKAIVNFVMGAAIRRLQDKNSGRTPKKYALLFHTEQSRESHDWQETVASTINKRLVELARSDDPFLNTLLTDSYEGLRTSVLIGGLEMPTFEDSVAAVRKALIDGYLMITKVNSDNDIAELLDERGQLKLRTPMNMFIGGQILDRGITIENLIGFYYGRNPKKFQQDTVLQHSRMYGSREPADLAVTRFYAPQHIYQVLEKIHRFDAALREAFESGSHDRGVYFIQRDAADRIVPCSPNKLVFSELTPVRPGKRLVPRGFQTFYKSHGKDNLAKLDNSVRQILQGRLDGTATVELDTALKLLELAYANIEYADESEDERKGHIAALEHLSKMAKETEAKGKVFFLAASNRDVARKRKSGRYSDAPDTKQQAEKAEAGSQHMPALMLLRQKGSEDGGWRGLEFWWPVIVPQQDAVTAVFAAETPSDEAIVQAAAGAEQSSGALLWGEASLTALSESAASIVRRQLGSDGNWLTINASIWQAFREVPNPVIRLSEVDAIAKRTSSDSDEVLAVLSLLSAPQVALLSLRCFSKDAETLTEIPMTEVWNTFHSWWKDKKLTEEEWSAWANAAQLDWAPMGSEGTLL